MCLSKKLIHMIKSLGIIQPGKIGDIIICLPIAKWYHDKGYKIVWPIDSKIISHFTDYIDYVSFVPIGLSCNVARKETKPCNHIIDLSFGFSESNPTNKNYYENENDRFSFDQLKYYIADVPFSEKWNLVINENSTKKTELMNKLSPGSDYTVRQEDASDYHISITPCEQEYIDISPIDGYSVFDWIGILSHAASIQIIESCFSNLIDQLGITARKMELYLKHGYYGKPLVDNRYRGIPVLKGPWTLK